MTRASTLSPTARPWKGWTTATAFVKEPSERRSDGEVGGYKNDGVKDGVVDGEVDGYKNDGVKDGVVDGEVGG